MRIVVVVVFKRQRHEQTNRNGRQTNMTHFFVRFFSTRNVINISSLCSHLQLMPLPYLVPHALRHCRSHSHSHSVAVMTSFSFFDYFIENEQYFSYSSLWKAKEETCKGSQVIMIEIIDQGWDNWIYSLFCTKNNLKQNVFA